MNFLLSDERAEPSAGAMIHEDHPTDFIVEGRDRQTQVWRRMFVHATDKNAAIADADERGVQVELVREAHGADRPKTGVHAEQREFGFGGVMSFALGIMGILTVAVAILMRQTSPSFALVAGILGAVLAVYGVAGATAFWVLSKTSQHHHQ